jgi:transcriptional regulator with XRE-family HTH domain
MITSYNIQSPEEVARDLATRFRTIRLSHQWKQRTLAERSGVTLASLRRFEQTGKVSLHHLLRLAEAMGCLDEFTGLLQRPEATSIAELEAQETVQRPRRGSK